MRIAIVGAGAIGGFIAAMLARAGNDVAVVARGAHLLAIQAHGLRVQSEAGAFTVDVRAGDDLRTLGSFDALLVTVKAHQLAGVLPQLGPALSEGATIVPMQNGLPFWYFADRTLESVDPGGMIHRSIPREQIVGSVIHVSGNIAAPGSVRQSGGMLYLLGHPDGGRSQRAEDLAKVMRAAGLDVPVAPSIKRDVWRKLLGNASLNPVSALTRLSIAPMVEDPQTRWLIATLMRETVNVAAASGIDVEISVEERIQYAGRLSDVKTSMLQDVEAGRPLELDPIVGAVIELADEFGLEVPALRSVYALTKALERSYLGGNAR